MQMHISTNFWKLLHWHSGTKFLKYKHITVHQFPSQFPAVFMHFSSISKILNSQWQDGLTITVLAALTKLIYVEPGRYWDGWPFAGIPSWYVNQPSRATQPSTRFLETHTLTFRDQVSEMQTHSASDCTESTLRQSLKTFFFNHY